MTKLPEKKSTSGTVVNPSIKPKRSFGIHVTRWMIVSLAVLAVFEVLITSNQATNGGKLASLQAEQDQLTQDITKLQRQMSQISSLTYIRQYATDKLGMVPVDKNVVYPMSQPTPTATP